MRIRLARVEEADALTSLVKRSKAHWGYDDEFMRLSEAALTITPGFIETARVLVAEDKYVLLGVASIAPMEEPHTFDLVHLFVEPGSIRNGTGRALFRAAAECARIRGGVKLLIAADPNAAAFYRRLGAKDAGQQSSESISGRMLPLLELTLGERA